MAGDTEPAALTVVRSGGVSSRPRIFSWPGVAQAKCRLGYDGEMKTYSCLDPEIAGAFPSLDRISPLKAFLLPVSIRCALKLSAIDQTETRSKR